MLQFPLDFLQKGFVHEENIVMMPRERSRLLLSVVFVFSVTVSHAGGWKRVPSTAGHWVASIEVFPGNADTVYAISDKGFLRSTDAGMQWDSIHALKTDIGDIAIDPGDSRRIHVSHWGLDFESNDISVTTDGGSSWTFSIFMGHQFPTAIVEYDPNNSSTIYAGVGPGFIQRSTNSGQTWNGLTTPPASGLVSLSISHGNDKLLFAGFVATSFKSTDGGATWTPLSLAVPSNGWARFACIPGQESTVVAAVYRQGFFKSTDAGDSWQEYNSGIDSASREFSAITSHPKKTNEIFLGLLGLNKNQSPLLRSTNSGQTWETFSQGLPPGGVISIAIDSLNDRLYAGVTGHDSVLGLYVYNDSTLDVEHPWYELPDIPYLMQNYPNPFNPLTSIEYQIPKADVVLLEVHDILGRKVQTLVNTKNEEGVHRVGFNAQGLPSGVYFYVLRADDFQAIKKMVLIR